MAVDLKWCEHSGGDPQVQGAPLEPFDTTNPDHVFEIHPIIKLNQISLLNSLVPIEGFQTKDAERAFTSYEKIDSTIVPRKTTTTIVDAKTIRPSAVVKVGFSFNITANAT